MKRLLIGASSSKIFHLNEFAKELINLGIETKVVFDTDFSDGFPSRKIKHWIKPKNTFKNLIKEFKPDIILVDRQRHFGLDAIKKGFDLIYKAFFIEDQFRGEADFLIKTKEKSQLGDYSYEVYDTKITKNLKPKHVLQITAYSYLISKITGVIPKLMYLIDGKSEYHSYKVFEFLNNGAYLSIG